MRINECRRRGKIIQYVCVCVSADPRLLGALRKTVSLARCVCVWGGGFWKNGWNAFVRVSLRLESRSRKALEKQYLFHGSVRFQLVFFFFVSSLCQETDFYVERVTAHHIKINDHSCFHNRLPNSKTKLKLKHLWEQGGPLVFRGPTQLAYSAYREDRLWSVYSSSTEYNVYISLFQMMREMRTPDQPCGLKFKLGN